MSDSNHHKCLLLCRRSVCFKLSSVQLGRPKAPCKNFYLWLLCVHPANSSYVPWFRPQVVCRALFSQAWSILCIPNLRSGDFFFFFWRGKKKYQAGVPIKLIKALGNWRSDTILHSANMLSKAILSHTPHHFHITNPSTTSTSGFGP